MIKRTVNQGQVRINDRWYKPVALEHSVDDYEPVDGSQLRFRATDNAQLVMELDKYGVELVRFWHLR